jgi:hypothetical protein
MHHKASEDLVSPASHQFWLLSPHAANLASLCPPTHKPFSAFVMSFLLANFYSFSLCVPFLRKSFLPDTTKSPDYVLLTSLSSSTCLQSTLTIVITWSLCDCYYLSPTLVSKLLKNRSYAALLPLYSQLPAQCMTRNKHSILDYCLFFVD